MYSGVVFRPSARVLWRAFFIPAFLLSLLALFPSETHAVGTGFLSPTATGGNHSEWTSPLNATSSNNLYATEGTEDDDQSYESFGFSIPTGATIDGIELRFEGFNSDATGCELQPRLFSTSAGGHSSRINQAVTGSDAVYTLGSASDLWGTTWQPSDFTAGNFHAEVQYDDASGNSCTGSFSLDHLQVQVHYTPPTVVPTFLETFGTSNTAAVTGWIETNPAEILGSTSGADVTRDATATNKFAKLGDDGEICKTFDATLASNLVLSYFFNGDDDAESSDFGVVEYRVGDCYSGGPAWSNIASHALDDASNATPVSWSGIQSFAFPAGVNNSIFSVRFRNTANSSNEYFRLDDISIQSGGTIVIDKVTVPSGDPQSFSFSGTGAFSAFSIADADAPVSQALGVATYSITETVPSGWTQTGASCVSSIGDTETLASLELDAGETVTCTVTNTKLGSIAIDKSVAPALDPTVFALTLTGPSTNVVANLADATGTSTTSSLLPGTYTISEGVVAGWDLTAISCSGATTITPNLPARSVDLTLAAGESASCIFTNTKRGALTIIKAADPDGAFGFTVTKPDTTTQTTNIITSGGTGIDSSTFASLVPGAYTVEETSVPASWTGVQTVSCASALQTVTGGTSASFTLAPGEQMACTFNNTQYSFFYVTKYEDMTGNGQTGDDPLLSGWTMNLYEFGSSTPLQTGITAGVGGSVLLSNLLPGVYVLCEEGQVGWNQIYPDGSHILATSCTTEGTTGYQVTVSAGVTYFLSFGNYRPGTITGAKWTDDDGDGVWDGSESARSGITIELYDASSVLASTTATDGTGAYSFTPLAPGVYTVKEVFPAGTWAQTYPGAALSFVHSFTLSSNETESGKNFGNAEVAVVEGMKYHDLDADGVLDGGEPGLSGWTITATPLDGSGNVATSTTRPIMSTTTGSSGAYSFTLYPAQLGRWKFEETMQSGWVQTSTTTPSYDLTLTTSGTTTAQDFGNWEQPEIQVYKWRDADADGVWDGGENPIGGWGFALGHVRATTTPNTLDVEIVETATTNALGMAALYPTYPGEWVVIEFAENNYERTYPSARASETLAVSFASGVTEEELDKNAWFDILVSAPSVAITTGDDGENSPATLAFGNVEYRTYGGVKFIPSSGIPTSTPSMRPLATTSAVTLTLALAGGLGNATISVPAGTTIDRDGGLDFSMDSFQANALMPSGVKGFPGPVTVFGVIQFGIDNTVFNFSAPITFSIFTGPEENGLTLDVHRSVVHDDLWGVDGLVNTTCTVSSGLCSFSATKASYYAANKDVTTPTSSGGGGGGGGGQPVGSSGTAPAGPGGNSGSILGVQTGGTVAGTSTATSSTSSGSATPASSPSPFGTPDNGFGTGGSDGFFDFFGARGTGGNTSDGPSTSTSTTSPVAPDILEEILGTSTGTSTGGGSNIPDWVWILLALLALGAGGWFAWSGRPRAS